LAKAVYAKCDRVDGLEDGLIDDPRRCVFDPSVDLPRCQGGIDGPSCFTNAQIEALKKIYGGVKDSSGKILFPGQPLGAEVSALGVDGVVKSGWDGTIVGTAGLYLPLVASYMQYMELDPPPGPSWDYRTFNFDTATATTAKFAVRFNATDANLSRVKRRGSKMIHYHGWADPAANALMSIDYYESVIRAIGANETREFYRLFLVPGMFHCRGGVGCNTADWISAIVDWVEKGDAPEKVIGTEVVAGQTKRTRPLCPYPEVARYKGRGSIDTAENFSCAAAR
jgi:feruloyl esterase